MSALEFSRLLEELGRAAEARAKAGKAVKADPANEAARRLLQAP